MPAFELRRCRAEMHERVREARAVHVHPQPVSLRDARELRELAVRVRAAVLRRLAHAEGARLALVIVESARVTQRVLEDRRVDLGVRTFEADELGAAAVELRRAALVRVEMRLRVAVHGAVGRCELRDGERVRGRAGDDGIELELGLEDLAETRAQPLRDRIVAVAACHAVVGARERCEDLGRDAGFVVAVEVASRHGVRRAPGRRQQVGRHATWSGSGVKRLPGGPESTLGARTCRR
jgi:hypothetical protein